MFGYTIIKDEELEAIRENNIDLVSEKLTAQIGLDNMEVERDAIMKNYKTYKKKIEKKETAKNDRALDAFRVALAEKKQELGTYGKVAKYIGTTASYISMVRNNRIQPRTARLVSLTEKLGK